MMKLFAVAAVLTAVLTAAARAEDYQQKANAAAWEWRPERSGLLWSMQTAPVEYEITVTRPSGVVGLLDIRIALDAKTNYTWKAHLGTPFLIRDRVLYYADYDPISDGCTVVAYDLTNKKQLWKTQLQALGGVDHSKYRNAVEMDFDGDALRVFGNESAGRYVEYVDLKEGKTVGHKVFSGN
jgi:opacity protein-like surface antigen